MDAETVALSALKQIHKAVLEYLPPEGINAKDCLSRVLAALDKPDVVSLLSRLPDDPA